MIKGTGMARLPAPEAQLMAGRPDHYELNILVHFTMLHPEAMNERKYSRVSGTEKSFCPIWNPQHSVMMH